MRLVLDGKAAAECGKKRGGLSAVMAVVWALVLLLATARWRPVAAECAEMGCRVFLPLVGGRHRLDMGEYGPEVLRWRHLGPTDRILDMTYDARGHLWSATEAGLVEWPPAPAAPIRHSLRAIRLVVVDASGAVWYGGESGRAGEGLHRRDPDGTLHAMGPAQGLPGGSLADLAADDRGQVFAGWRVGEVGGGGLSRIDAAGEVRSWRQADGLKHRDVTLLTPDGDGGAWYAQVDEEGRPMPGLGLLSASGQLRPDVAMPEAIKDLPVVGLESGGDGRILVIFAAPEERRSTSRVDGGASRAGGGETSTLLFQRDARGNWSEISLPLQSADEQRLQPMGFDPGPRSAIADADGLLWVVLEGIVVSLSPSGRLRFQPTNESGGDGELRGALAEMLGSETAVAARPGGGLAVASVFHAGLMLLDAAPGSVPVAVADPAALPSDLTGITADPSGTVYLTGGQWPEQGAWQAPDVDGVLLRLGEAPRTVRTTESDIPTTIGPAHVTPDGVYWVADGRNLLRLSADRRQRTVIRPADGLTGGAITCFATGADGTLWVGTTKGLVHLDAAGRWRRQDPAVPARPIADIASSPDGTLWLALPNVVIDGSDVDGGVIRLQPDGKTDFWFSGPLYGIKEGFGLGQFAVAVGGGGTVWTAGSAGLALRDASGSWRPMNHEAGLENFDLVIDVAVDSRGQVWAAPQSGGALRYEPGRDRWTLYDDAIDGIVTAIVADGGGSVWFGRQFANDGGATLIQRDPVGRWHQVSLRAFTGGDLDAPVRGLAMAPDGTVVQTTFDDALLLFGPSGKGLWMPQDRLPPLSSDAQPMCAGEDRTLWVLLRQGVASYRRSEGWRIEQSADGLPYRSFSSITCALDGSLWLGNPPLSFDQQRRGEAPSGTVRRLPDGRWQDLSQELGLGVEGVSAIAAAADGTVALVIVRPWMPGDTAAGPWIHSGLLLRRADGRLRRLSMEQLSAGELRAQVYGPDGTLWLASERGVSRLDPGGGGVPVALPSVGLPSPDVRGLAWARGHLWAATAAGAAERLPDRRWRPIEEGDGLGNGDLRGVVAGPRGELWFLDATGSISVLEP